MAADYPEQRLKEAPSHGRSERLRRVVDGVMGDIAIRERFEQTISGSRLTPPRLYAEAESCRKPLRHYPSPVDCAGKEEVRASPGN